jgi:predicted nucleic-acid-binding Zn-ribbon protein
MEGAELQYKDFVEGIPAAKNYVKNNYCFFPIIEKYVEATGSNVYITGSNFFKVFRGTAKDVIRIFPANILEFLNYIKKELPSDTDYSSTRLSLSFSYKSTDITVRLGCFEDFNRDVVALQYSDLRKIFYDVKEQKFIMQMFLRCAFTKKFKVTNVKNCLDNEYNIRDDYVSIYGKDSANIILSDERYYLVAGEEKEYVTTLKSLDELSISLKSYKDLHGIKKSD